MSIREHERLPHTQKERWDTQKSTLKVPLGYNRHPSECVILCYLRGDLSLWDTVKGVKVQWSCYPGKFHKCPQAELEADVVDGLQGPRKAWTYHWDTTTQAESWLRNSCGTRSPDPDALTPLLRTISSQHQGLTAVAHWGAEPAPQEEDWKQWRLLLGHRFKHGIKVYTVLSPRLWLSGTLKCPPLSITRTGPLSLVCGRPSNLLCFLRHPSLDTSRKITIIYLSLFSWIILEVTQPCLKIGKSPSGALINSLCLQYLNR